MNPRLQRLREAGVSIWLDTLSRELLETGELARLVASFGVTGATSNPTIFAKALQHADRYEEQLAALREAGVSDPRELFLELALEDIRRAAATLRPVFDRTSSDDGFVSFECTPDVADDTDATVEQALALWERIDRPNVMIKVPGTAAGVPAIEELTARGVNVNVTLLFSVERYADVIDAYERGRGRRHGGPDPVSVASFFVSRIDAKADALLDPGSPLRGRIAIANAHRAYALYAERRTAQRPLWASTGTKNPSYSDVLYVERLVAPRVVSTMPAATLHAFADHGEVGPALGADLTESDRVLAEAARAGIDLDAITAELEREGIRSFCESYAELLDYVATVSVPSSSEKATSRE